MVKTVQINVLENAIVVDVLIPEIEKERYSIVMNMPEREGRHQTGLHEGDQEAELWSSDQVVDNEVV